MPEQDILDPQPFGIPLDSLQAALEAGHLLVHREGNSIVGRHEGGLVTRVLVERPDDFHSELGTVKAVILVQTELPAELGSLLRAPEHLAVFNPMTTLGALTNDDGKLVLSSRIVVYKEENAWDLQALLIIGAALSGAPTMLNAIHQTLSRQRDDSTETESEWSDEDMDVVRSYLSKFSVCTAGHGGLTAEFSLRDGELSAADGAKRTALWRMMTEQPHPSGAGLFTLLEMPHRIPDKAQLAWMLDRLNNIEMQPGDQPPHIGAWCPGTLGDNPAYVTFLPNFLHSHSGIAVNVSFWAMSRAQWANGILASRGIFVE